MKNETIHAFFSVILGSLTFLVGGFGSLMMALLIVMGVDWLTGVLKSLKERKFSPSLGLWGIVNKIVSILVVITVNFLQSGAGIQLPLRETVIIMLLINEGLSVLRNSSYFVSGLEPLTKYFESVKLNVLKIFTVVSDSDNWNGEERRDDD